LLITASPIVLSRSVLERPLHAHIPEPLWENAMIAVSEVMTRDPVKLAPADSMQRAAELMRTFDVGAIAVCDSKILIGMVTDRDIVIRGVSQGREVCTRDVERCYEDDDVETVRGAMKDSQIRRVPVLNRDQELVGIVSLGDLATRGIKIQVIRLDRSRLSPSRIADGLLQRSLEWSSQRLAFSLSRDFSASRSVALAATGLPVIGGRDVPGFLRERPLWVRGAQVDIWPGNPVRRAGAMKENDRA
jgi:CBS domain-containing protein